MSLTGQIYYRVAGTRPGHRALREGLHLARRFGALREFAMPLDGLDLPYASARQLMRLRRRLHWSSADGMMTPQERLAIYRIACACCVDGDFVELGAWKGLTTCYLAAACRARGHGRVIAVDTFAGTREHDTRYAAIDRHGGSTLPAFQAFVERCGFKDLISACVGLTVDAAAQHRDRPIALLLIDADHSYAGVKADFNAWLPLMAPGGILIFHDYAMPDAGVRAFVQREVTQCSDILLHPGEVLPNIFAVKRRG